MKAFVNQSNFCMRPVFSDALAASPMRETYKPTLKQTTVGMCKAH